MSQFIPQAIPLKLTNRETESTIDTLEHAITYHQEWLNRFHESLICGSPFCDDVYSDDAHQHCKLGQWYFHRAPAILKIFGEFDMFERVHADMHKIAR